MAYVCISAAVLLEEFIIPHTDISTAVSSLSPLRYSVSLPLKLSSLSLFNYLLPLSVGNLL